MESQVIRTYLETIAELPWGKRDEEHLDVAEAAKILDEDHYGLDDVKDRVLEFLAVHQLAKGKDTKGRILLFSGPPGVGKTSIAKSIARAMGRKYVRDLARRRARRGRHPRPPAHVHRRAAGPHPRRHEAGRQQEPGVPARRGRQARRVVSRRPGDARCSRSSTRRRTTRSPITTSACRSICPRCCSSRRRTSSQNIPGPLLDRMEVVDFAGYTEREKLAIAKHYLVQRALDGQRPHRRAARRSPTTRSARSSRSYTREAGVRNLERELGRLARKVARESPAKETERRRRRPRRRARAARPAARPPRKEGGARIRSASRPACTTRRRAATSCSSRRRRCAARAS